MRKFLFATMLLLCSLVIFSDNAKAAEKKSGKYRYLVLDQRKRTAAITHVSNPGATVIIPKRIKGYTVVQVGGGDKSSINYCIFADKDTGKIKQIFLPDTVRKISKMALMDCGKLKKIDLPKELRSIEAYALEDCHKIKKVVLPKKLKYIGKGAFQSCYNLEKVVFKTNQAKIGEYAFCTGSTHSSDETKSHLKKVEFPVTYKGKIMDGAFCSFIGTEFIWVNFTSDYNGKFLWGVTSLKKIKVHPKARKAEIPRNCLDGCARQVEIVVPKNVESVHIWQQCYNIKQITIYGMDTTLKGDYFMGKYHEDIMISVETVKCKRKSVAWEMASQYICPDFTNVDWENFTEESIDYNENNIEFKQVKLIRL